MSLALNAGCPPVWYVCLGLVGLYSGVSWGFVSLVPFAICASALHSSCLAAVTAVSQRLNSWQQDARTPQVGSVFNYSDIGRTDSDATGKGDNGSDEAELAASWGHLRGVHDRNQFVNTGQESDLTSPCTVSILSAYFCSRLAQALIYPFETMR